MPRVAEGSIQQVVYRQTTAGLFYALGAIPVSAELNSIFQMGITWLNTSEDEFEGHIELIVTKPDGTTVTPEAVMGQDLEVDPSNSATVLFEAITLDQYGTYSAQATLTEAGETEVLDLETFSFATVAEPAVGFDISSIMAIVGLAFVGILLFTLTKTK
ncbi:unnamed protein product [marine sediment metagenome]|uniref:Uncharacterized protein n=1 Tax=marine sediment metagenome TaxID=412755 RepID=X1SVS6_9ZZZZ